MKSSGLIIKGELKIKGYKIEDYCIMAAFIDLSHKRALHCSTGAIKISQYTQLGPSYKMTPVYLILQFRK